MDEYSGIGIIISHHFTCYKTLNMECIENAVRKKTNVFANKTTKEIFLFYYYDYT